MSFSFSSISKQIQKLFHQETGTPADAFSNTCEYLKDVLNFRDFIIVPDSSDSTITVSKEELKSGNLNEKTQEKLRKWFPKSNSEKDINDIIIIPKSLNDIIQKASTQRGYKGDAWEYERISLFYIKAQYDDKYGLKCINGESLVWADPIITHKENNKERVLEVKGVSFELKQPQTSFNCDEGWKDYINSVASVYQERTGKDLFSEDEDENIIEDRTGKKHVLSDEIIIMKDSTVFAQSNIIKLLDDILNTLRDDLDLLQNMLCGNKSKEINRHKLGANVKCHQGQMKPDYPLADAQRDVLHCFTKLHDGEVLAVSGPPGTGKTTVLQSIVAQSVVDFTIDYIEKKDEKTYFSSPLILATSSNNKAITNIIDAFNIDNSLSAINPLYGRWIHRISKDDTADMDSMLPLAVYMPASMSPKNERYFRTNYNGGADYGALREYYIEHSDTFLETANDALGKSFSDVWKIKKRLNDELLSCMEELSIIARILDKKPKESEELKEKIHKILHKYTISKDGGVNYVNQDRMSINEYVDKYLDQTLRHHMFWLAVHYNECRWIEKMQRIKQNRVKNIKAPQDNAYGKYLFDEIRFICPCIVATLYRTPSIFSYGKRDEAKHYNYKEADLLIVDESGQVSPEIGLPAFALAKKAIVVGDVKQIPPVHSINQEIDDAYCKYSGIECEQHVLLSCYSSSVMNVATSRSRFDRINANGDVTEGLFLNEHRRCVDEIISYSDDLLYKNELIPKRGKSIDTRKIKDLPPMCILNVDSQSGTKNGSRYNYGEISVLKKWIQRNEESILDAYNKGKKDNDKKKITDLVNIITPFKAQVREIRKDPYLRLFPNGTVHTFQGAESPIVLFSMVYSTNDTPTFIMKNHELMNVAVSRAKDHFIVVGSKECLYRNLTDRACKLLFEKTEEVFNNNDTNE